MAVQRVKIDGLEIDAVVSYEPVHDAEATRHPIEQGAEPTDHIRILPITLQIEGVQSATPVDAELRKLGADKLALRPREAYEFLEKIIGKLVTVDTELRSYENMALLHLSAPRDPNTGDALNFSAHFQQVRVVSNLTVEEPTNLLAKKSVKDLGKQNASPTSEATKKKSVAAKLADSKTGTAALARLKQFGATFFGAVGIGN